MKILSIFLIILFTIFFSACSNIYNNVSHNLENSNNLADCNSYFNEKEKINCIKSNYESKGVDVCKDFESYSLRVFDRNDCYTVLAIENNDPSFCDLVSEWATIKGVDNVTIEKNICLSELERSIPVMSKDCENEEGLKKDYCYLEQAKATNNTLLCEKIESKEGGITVQRCKSAIEYVTITDFNNCKYLEDVPNFNTNFEAQMSCINRLAVANNKEIICEEIQNLDWHNGWLEDEIQSYIRSCKVKNICSPIEGSSYEACILDSRGKTLDEFRDFAEKMYPINR